jgi:hypothetical protein
MTSTDQQKPLSVVEKKIVLFVVFYSAILLLAHWYFFASLHGGGGVLRGLNAVFQIVGNLFAIVVAIALLVSAIMKKVSPYIGVFSALLLGLLGFYCLRTAFAMMMSI